MRKFRGVEMKKLFFFFLVLATTIACSTEEEEKFFFPSGKGTISGIQMITEIISGSHGPSTKATIADSDASFSWTAGDNIAVHVSKGTSHKYVTTADEGASGASVTAETASFTVAYEEGYYRDAFAVFPSNIVDVDAANYGQTGANLDVTLPGSYTFDQVKGETSPCPMIASNTGSNWEFFQLCGLLRLTVSGIHPNTKRLEINFNGKKVWGDFSIAAPVSPGNSVIKTDNDDEHNYDIITITKDGNDVTLNNENWMDLLVLNIPLPTGGPYSNITVTAYDALSAGTVLFTTTTTLPVSYTADYEHGTKKFACFPVFSVSSTQRVIFAPGNLQATTSDYGNHWTWSFAAKQYDYIGDTQHNPNSINAQLTSVAGKTSANGTVDLFYRSLPDNEYGITSQSETDASFVDWTGLSIDSNGPDYWRTLTESEWLFVVGKGTDGRYCHFPDELPYARGTKAIINTDGTPVKGYIIFPDYYPIPTAGEKVKIDNIVIIEWGAGINSTGTSGWNTTCTTAGWNYLESAGCVFLPAAGYRDGTTLYQIGELGHYKHATYWRRFRFNDAGYDPNDGNPWAGSVRLVHSEGLRGISKEGYKPVSF